MGARRLWLYPDDPLIPPDEPPPNPRHRAEIYEQITGRPIGRWDPRTETIEALHALLDRLFAETEHGPDMDCLPTMPMHADLDSYVYAMDHRGMCLVVDDFKPIAHLDEVLRGRALPTWGHDA